MAALNYGCIEDLYGRLGLEMDEAFRQVLDQEAAEARQYTSRHHYSLEEYGLSREQLYRELREVFEEYGFEPMHSLPSFRRARPYKGRVCRSRGCAR